MTDTSPEPFACWLCYDTGFRETWEHPLAERFCSCAQGQRVKTEETES